MNDLEEMSLVAGRRRRSPVLFRMNLVEMMAANKETHENFVRLYNAASEVVRRENEMDAYFDSFYSFDGETFDQYAANLDKAIGNLQQVLQDLWVPEKPVELQIAS